MENDLTADIKTEITTLLKRKKKKYLTVTQIRNGLSTASLKQLGLSKKRPPTEVLRHLKPHMGDAVWEYRGARAAYIGFGMSPEDMILDKIKKKPGLSSKNVAKNLPMLKKEFIASLNQLLESGTVICTFNENHLPSLKISPKIGRQTHIQERPIDGRAAFKSAYDRVGKGQHFVRIHRIRDHLSWPRERFDRMLMELMADYTIELHGGDPSIMAEREIRESFADENGLLYINLTWWGKNDERQ